MGQNGPFVYGTGVNFAPWATDPVPMWQLGYNPGTWVADRTRRHLATTIRDGNFDYVTNPVRWDRTPQSIPDSLTSLASRPSSGSSPWPWVDALGATKTAVLPARQRFDTVLHP